MNSKLHKNQSGQAALETAIILIAFVVVASVFAFAILSAGSASTERGEEAIYAGLENVQSSMQVKGAVIATSSSATAVSTVVFTVAPVSGGEPINLDTVAPEVIIAYRDNAQQLRDVDFDVAWIVQETVVADRDNLLEDGELAEITVNLATAFAAETPVLADLGPNQAFTLEVKPPTGGTIVVHRTTPAALEDVMELH
ncbi:MAG: hypothetical protein IPK19_01175 [Chloroflexi bacterium]|nr:hypothetical protein [Chloroflexota bacterium]